MLLREEQNLAQYKHTNAHFAVTTIPTLSLKFSFVVFGCLEVNFSSVLLTQHLELNQALLIYTEIAYFCLLSRGCVLYIFLRKKSTH